MYFVIEIMLPTVQVEQWDQVDLGVMVTMIVSSAELSSSLDH